MLSLLVITFFALKSFSGNPSIIHLDKLVHLFIFIYLSWLVDRSAMNLFYMSDIVLLIVYGILIEFLQSFTTTRSPELLDFLFDFFGVLVYFYLIPKLKSIMQ